MFISLPRSDSDQRLDARLGSVCKQSGKSGEQSEALTKEKKKLACLDWIGSARPSHLRRLVGLVRPFPFRPPSKTFALQPTWFKMRLARRILKPSSGSRTFTSSTTRRGPPSATDRAESAQNTKGLNRYSRTVTQPKDQGASQVGKSPSFQLHLRPSKKLKHGRRRPPIHVTVLSLSSS